MTAKHKCDICGIELTKEQLQIEKKITNDMTPCYCQDVIKMDRLNKKMKEKYKEFAGKFQELCEEYAKRIKRRYSL